MADTGVYHDVDVAYGGFKFRVYFCDATGNELEGEGTIAQSFVKVSGVDSESEIVEYMQGTDYSVSTSPGRVKFANVTLDRVYKGPDALYHWRRQVEQGSLVRKNIKIEMLTLNSFTTVDGESTCIRSIILDRAWPCKWTMPDLDASSSSPSMETIELAVASVWEEIHENPLG